MVGLYTFQILTDFYFCTFHEINGLIGGAIYNDCKINLLNGLCFHTINGTYGSSIFSRSSNINQLNHTSILNNYASQFATWDLLGGPSSIFSINVSNSISLTREVSGHYGGGPICNSKYYFVHKTKGPGIFGPFSLNLNNMYHELCTFYNNTAGNLGIIIIWDGKHYLNNSYFFKNIGILSSSGLDEFIGRGTLYFINSNFDSNFSGYYSNTINCNFNLNNIQIFNFKILVPEKCVSYYSQEKKKFYFISILYIQFFFPLFIQ